MLDFFRKYQRYFFLVITVVIIISFSFFGTYSTLGSNQWREQIAFNAVNGKEVTRADVDEMALFLGTDSEDKMLYGGAWGPNFLNDGVIRKDFFETGLAEELALAYQQDLQADIDKRLAKEKKYVLYSHPQANFLGVASVWNNFAPEMSTNFRALRASQNGLEPSAFKNRVNLYLGEKKVPASTLRYVLQYQQKQYQWLKPDEKLNQTDLSLFGYHTLEDWFGPHFTRLISEFIMNAAILAESQGYKVSKAEVLSDLVRNTQTSYQQNQNNPNLGVTSPEEYLNEQLRRMNMDQARAVKVWSQVLLFRRYFHDAGATALVDPIVNKNLHQFAHENVTVDLYQLPEPVRLSNYQELQEFETYLQAVAKTNKSDPLALPQQFLSAAEVEKNYPELVQNEYELEVATATEKNLQAKISLKEMWNWQVDDKNWELLVKQFPTLGPKQANSRDARFEVLESLEPTTRTIVNGFAKQEIVKAHPEWIDEELSRARVDKMMVGLRSKGGKMPFQGFDKQEDREAFLSALDKAPLGQAPAENSPLHKYSADNQNFYRITVVSRSSKPEILTFEEASEDGTLKDIVDRQLEKYYVANRDKSPALFQVDEKEWKPFKAVKELVANQYFEKLVSALEPIQKSVSSDPDKKSWSKDQAASLRFYPYLKKIKEGVEKKSPETLALVKDLDGTDEESSKPATLADQWKVEKTTETYDRQSEDENDLTDAYGMNDGEWSALRTPVNGDVSFFQLTSKGTTEFDPASIAEQAKEAQFMLGAEAQRHLMRQVLQELKSKNALSLAYMKTPSDEAEAQAQEEAMND